MSAAGQSTPPDVSCGFARAITDGDVERALEYWADNAVMVAPDGAETRGHAALRERFVGLVDVGARLDIEVRDVAVTNDGATASTTMRMALGPGADAVVITTTAVVSYTSQDGVLRILRDEIRAVET